MPKNLKGVAAFLLLATGIVAAFWYQNVLVPSWTEDQKLKARLFPNGLNKISRITLLANGGTLSLSCVEPGGCGTNAEERWVATVPRQARGKGESIYGFVRSLAFVEVHRLLQPSEVTPQLLASMGLALSDTTDALEIETETETYRIRVGKPTPMNELQFFEIQTQRDESRDRRYFTASSALATFPARSEESLTQQTPLARRLDIFGTVTLRHSDGGRLVAKRQQTQWGPLLQDDKVVVAAEKVSQWLKILAELAPDNIAFSYKGLPEARRTLQGSQRLAELTLSPVASPLGAGASQPTVMTLYAESHTGSTRRTYYLISTDSDVVFQLRDDLVVLFWPSALKAQ